jgi:phosphoglucomutase
MKSTFNLLKSQWLSLNIDQSLKKEIQELCDEELTERLSHNIQFGTAGLRGLMGAGFNRINEYTIKKTSFALSLYLKDFLKLSSIKIIVAYDTRHHSRFFAQESAKIFLDQGFKVTCFDFALPAPLLAYAVKFYKANMGVMITASHNPKEYNGYKVYSQNGGQISSSTAQNIYDIIESIKDIPTTHGEDLSKIKKPDQSFFDAYYKEIKKYLNLELLKQTDVKVLYTPLFGTGKRFLEEICKDQLGLDFTITSSQKEPDGDFPFLRAPNPEDPNVFKESLKQASIEKNDLILATDPDSDRIGVMASNNDNTYTLLNGNEIGMIMTYYILSEKQYNDNSYICSTVVSTDIVRKICADYRVRYQATLTGFKYIAQTIEKNPLHFLFAFEESQGYLLGNYILDKDGILSNVFMIEIMAFLKKQNKTMVQYLREIQEKYGFFKSSTLTFKTPNDQVLRNCINFFQSQTKDIFGFPIKAKYNFQTQENFNNDETLPFIDLKQYPSSELFIFYLEPYFKVAVRASGTEPILKIYVEIQASRYSYSQKNEKKSYERVISIREYILSKFRK